MSLWPLSSPARISIHAPSRERRQKRCDQREPYHFNPRSLAGATWSYAQSNAHQLISIHAPSRERLSASSSAFGLSNFNPRSLAGATLARVTAFRPARNFNPRSLAGATERNAAKDPGMAISIHAPSRERRTSSSTSVQYLYFNPRSLAGATKTKQQMLRQSSHFNPRSLAGATECVPSSDEPKPHFNPRSLAGATTHHVF